MIITQLLLLSKQINWSTFEQKHKSINHLPPKSTRTPGIKKYKNRYKNLVTTKQFEVARHAKLAWKS